MANDLKFRDSFDARDWAKAFVEYVKANPSIATDEETMVGWFANAIMRGYDEYPRERPWIARVEKARQALMEGGAEIQ